MKLCSALLIALFAILYVPVSTRAAEQVSIGQLLAPAGNMLVSRQGHTAILLPDGKVLIVGGLSLDQLRSGAPVAEIYDPDSGSFTAVDGWSRPGQPTSVTLLRDGRVLLLEAERTGNTSAIYDPVTGVLTGTGGTATNQIGGIATLLDNGKVLVAGGSVQYPSSYPNNFPILLANPELYDPATGTFSPTGTFATTGNYLYVSGGPSITAVGSLGNGKVLIAAEPASEIYDPAASSFSLTDRMTTNCSLGRRSPEYIAGRTITLLQDGNALLTGGGDDNCGRFAQAEIYDASGERFVPTPEMTRRRDNHAATLLGDGTVLITGGETEDCASTSCSSAATTDSVELYDPSSGNFYPAGKMVQGRAGHTATLLKDGRVLITGGYGYGGGFFWGTFSSAEIYTPPAMADRFRPNSAP